MDNSLLGPIVTDENGTDIQNDQSAFIQKLIGKLLDLWPWLILSSVICLCIAFFYYKMSTPVYTAFASVLVQDDKKGTDFGQSSVLQDFGLLVDKSSVDNEVEIFKSRTLMEQVIKELQLNVRYYYDGKVRKKELFAHRPISLHFLEISYLTPAAGEYSCKITADRKFTISGGGASFRGKVGDTVKLQIGTAILVEEPNYDKWDIEEPIEVNVGTLEFTTMQYMNALNVVVPNKLVSVINLALNEALPEKGEVILNKLIAVYLQANVNDKSRTADSTVNFIDERLKLVFKELSLIEGDMEGFKIANKLTNVGEQARLLLENTSEYAKLQTTQEVQLSVVNSLESFLKENINNDRAVPSSLVMQDPSFIALIEKYNQVQFQRDNMLMSKTREHPMLETINEQLKNLRLELLSSIASVKREILINIQELRKRTTSFDTQIAKIPAKERTFLDYSRQQAIKQELYLFLLKKREETAISKSSTIANARIIDAGKSNNIPISPKRNKMLLIGLLAGLIIPFAISYTRDFLNNKVSSLEDIGALTKVPVLSEIGHNTEGNAVAITNNSRTVIAEQLRALRTNLQYVLPAEGQKMILVTSSMSGEGKSFLSINLCSSLALAGKKVILLELDLRRPKISDNLNLTKQGFTNFIVSVDNSWKSWVQKSGVHDNFYVLSSGPLPPNPSELLMLPKVELLFNQLKSEYDYVIIDTAPIGLVTDAQIIAGLANLTLYVIRHAYTYKHQVRAIEKLFRKNSLPKMNIVINDVNLKKSGYGYGYGYGYSVYGYDSEVK